MLDLAGSCCFVLRCVHITTNGYSLQPKFTIKCVKVLLFDKSHKKWATNERFFILFGKVYLFGKGVAVKDRGNVNNRDHNTNNGWLM